MLLITRILLTIQDGKSKGTVLNSKVAFCQPIEQSSRGYVHYFSVINPFQGSI